MTHAPSSTLALAAFVFLMSCDSKSPPPVGEPGPFHRSGSRLRARVVDAGGGARQLDWYGWQGWYDTQLASPCTFQLAEDQVRRCVPMAYSINTEPDYADAACTIPVVTGIDPNQEAPYFASSSGTVSPVACTTSLAAAANMPSGTIAASWRIGAAQPAPPVLYFRDSGGCIRRPDLGVTVVYPLERVAPADLVRVTATRVEPRGESLAVQAFEHDDGSGMTGGLFDVSLQQPCIPSWGFGVTDDYRCYGRTPERNTGIFSCTPNEPGSCEGDLFMGFIDGCAPPSLVRLSGGTCNPVELSQIPMLASDLLGTGRVRLVITHAADDARPLMVNPDLFESGGRYRRGPFFDTERQLACTPVAIEDGTLRCLTQDVISTFEYSDATCTQLVAPKRVGVDGCATRAPPVVPQFAIAGSPARIYALGTEVHLEQRYWLIPGTTPPRCELSSGPNDAYELAPADASIFAILTRETE